MHLKERTVEQDQGHGGGGYLLPIDRCVKEEEMERAEE